ncbi:50S ribosomal protein L32 [bacterium]|nr:50S ribosomal protein L32 [bacterium]
MPLPKRRHSPTRGRKRRTHWKITAPRVVTCDCGESKLSHHVCPHCGEYKGRKLLNISEA